MDFKTAVALLLMSSCLIARIGAGTPAGQTTINSCVEYEYRCDPETGDCGHVLAVTADSLQLCNCSNFEAELQQLRSQLQRLSERGCQITEEDDPGTTVATTIKPAPPRDCDDLYELDPTMSSGVYEVTPENYHTILVYCEIDNDQAWTVIQRRLDDSVYFGRTWSHYRHGFGQIDGTHWLGNEQIHHLTSQAKYALHIDMVDHGGQRAMAKYYKFHVDSENRNYRLKVGYYHGTAGDSLRRGHNRREFSTSNRDNDQSETSNCAELYQGGWWYGNCADSNLNGPYYGMFWETFGGAGNHLQRVTMKIRKKATQ